MRVLKVIEEHDLIDNKISNKPSKKIRVSKL
jgi:hypothetical protein